MENKNGLDQCDGICLIKDDNLSESCLDFSDWTSIRYSCKMHYPISFGFSSLIQLIFSKLALVRNCPG